MRICIRKSDKRIMEMQSHAPEAYSCKTLSMPDIPPIRSRNGK